MLTAALHVDRDARVCYLLRILLIVIQKARYAIEIVKGIGTTIKVYSYNLIMSVFKSCFETELMTCKCVKYH